MEIHNFQRVGSISNAQVGREFEELARIYFAADQINLKIGFSIPVGVGEIKKEHCFDLGCNNLMHGKIIIECKSHTWTSGGECAECETYGME